MEDTSAGEDVQEREVEPAPAAPQGPRDEAAPQPVGDSTSPNEGSTAPIGGSTCPTERSTSPIESGPADESAPEPVREEVTVPEDPIVSAQVEQDRAPEAARVEYVDGAQVYVPSLGLFQRGRPRYDIRPLQAAWLPSGFVVTHLSHEEAEAAMAEQHMADEMARLQQG